MTKRTQAAIFLACSVCTLLATRTEVAFADWPGFLGPGGNPVVAESNLPTDFQVAEGDQAAKNVVWRVALPGRSVCGPVVVGNRVFTSSSSAMEGRWMHVSAVDATTGEVLWNRSTKATGRPYCHPTSANAAPTPCTDGERIFAFFSSNDAVCYDLDGNLQWFRSLTDRHPLAGNDVGMSSSPLVVDGVVVLSIECQADSFTTGLDALTGETLWELTRDSDTNWASPRVATGKDGEKVVLLQASNELLGVEPSTGKVAWKLDESCSTVASCVVVGNKIYVPGNGVRVFELGTALEKPELVWEASRLSPRSASLLVNPLGVIGLNRSVLVCCKDGGELRWQARLPDAGQFWSTPVIAGDYLYGFAMDGTCFVVKLSEDTGELVGEYKLGEEVLGSPAVSDKALYVRSVDALWKIAE